MIYQQANDDDNEELECVQVTPLAISERYACLQLWLTLLQVRGYGSLPTLTLVIPPKNLITHHMLTLLLYRCTVCRQLPPGWTWSASR